MTNAAITSAEAEARCLRCHRKLRTTKAPYGPKCAAKIRREAREHALDGLNDRQRDKAIELVADGGLLPTNRDGVFHAVSSDGSTKYLTTVEGNCSCPWGQRRVSALTKPCAHVGAARLVQVTTRKRFASAA